MLYIVSAECIKFLEIGEIIEKAKEDGHEVILTDSFKTAILAAKVFRSIMNDHGFDPELTNIISDQATDFAAAIMTGANFTWALDIY